MTSTLFRLALAPLLLVLCVPASAEVNGNWQNNLSLGDSIMPMALAREGDRALIGGGALDTSNLMRPWRPRVMLSDDDGLTFRNIEGPLGQQNTSDPIRAAAFAGPAVVVARGSSVFRSTDEGTTWTPGEAPGTVHALHFHDAASGVAIGDGGMLAFTEDAGQTFEAVASPTSVPLRGMDWADPSHGWAWGYTERRAQGPGGESGVTIGEGTLLHTADGGRTWEEVHRFDGLVVGPAFFPTPDVGWVVTAERTSDEGLRAIASLARTSDRGRTLAEMPLPEAVGELRPPFGSSQDLRISYIPGLRFDTPSTGRLAALVHLFDSQSGSGGGGSNTTQRVSGFRLLDLKTEDGGATWQYTGLGEVRASLTGVDAPNDGHVVHGALAHAHDGLLVTDDGRIWRWNNVCTSASDCLGQVPCTGGRCVPPAGGSFRGSGPDAGFQGGEGENGAPGDGADGPPRGRDRDLPGNSDGKGCAAVSPSSAGTTLAFAAFVALVLASRRRRMLRGSTP